MATFGKTDIEGTVFGASGDRIFVTRFPLDVDALSVTELNAYLAAESPPLNAKMALYSDAEGIPDRLIAVTEERQLTGTLSWIAFPFPTPFSLTAGYYWIALFVEGAINDYRFISGPGYENQTCHVARWYGDGFPDPYTPDIWHDFVQTVYGVYTPTAPIIHTLTIIAEAGGTTDPTPGTHDYDEGAVVTVTAIPNADYSFSHWELDGVVHTKNPINVTMDADHTLRAFFTAVPPAKGILEVHAYI